MTWLQGALRRRRTTRRRRRHAALHSSTGTDAAVCNPPVYLFAPVAAGPTPLIKSDLLHDAPTDGVKAGSTGGTGGSETGGSGGGLVAVDFLGESLCPDCRHMVVDVLQPLFANGVAELMHLR